MNGGTNPTRVVLFDDSLRHNTSFSRELTEAGIVVAGVAGTAREMHELVKTVPFDVALLDVLVGASDDPVGLGIGLWLRMHRPDIGVLMFTSFDSEFGALRLLKVNPHGLGYLIKNRVHDTRDVVRAIAAVRDRRNVLDDKIKAALLPLHGQTTRVSASPPRRWRRCAWWSRGTRTTRSPPSVA